MFKSRFTFVNLPLLQAKDPLDAGLGWLAFAEKYDLPQFAASAKRWVVDNGGNIATCPAAKKLSRECLLRLLDARHIEKRDVQRIMVDGTYPPPGKSPYVWYREKRGMSPL